MKSLIVATLLAVALQPAVFAQQFAPPVLPPGVQGKSETVDAEITKVYSLDDQGAKFRAYVVKYKGTEVVVNDSLAQTDRKVGDKVKLLVVRVEQPFAGGKINSLSFQILNVPSAKK